MTIPPVLNQTQQPPAGEAVGTPQVQQGVGVAPTTMQPAVNEPTPSQEPKQRGYVYRAIIAIRDWIVWFFSKLFCCKQEEPVPSTAPQSSPTPSQVPQQTAPSEAYRISEGLRSDMDLLDAFGKLTEATQKRIYYLIGKENSWGWSLRSYETRGKNAVEQNPQLLKNYLEKA